MLTDIKWTATLTGITTLCCFIPNIPGMDSLRIQTRITQRRRFLVAHPEQHHAVAKSPYSQRSDMAILQTSISQLVLDVVLHRYRHCDYNSGSPAISVHSSSVQFDLVFVATATQAFVVLLLALAASVSIGRGSKEKTQ